ncbi:MAG: NfeD family protein [Thermogutta sp.]
MYRRLRCVVRLPARFHAVGAWTTARFKLAMLVFAAVTCTIGAFNAGSLVTQATAEEQPSTLRPNAPSGETEERFGRVIPVRLPITGPTSTRVKQTIQRILTENKEDQARLVLILRFDTVKGEEQFATRSEFGACYDLADFLTSETLSRVQTVAYVPYRAEGHAVLPIMACREIVLSPNAEWGAAGIAERRITPPILSAYRHIAERNRTIPPTVALGMLDGSRSVLLVETDVERLFISEDELESIAKQRTLRGSPSVFFPAGQLGRLTGRESRRFDLISATAADSREAYAALGLKANLVEEERIVADHWKAVQVEITGPITPVVVERCQRLIEEAVQKRNTNFVCIKIDSAGGNPNQSLTFANYLAADLDPDKVRTVAYIPSRALADASLIAVACDHIVMRPEALIGGEGDGIFADEEKSQARRALREIICKKTGRSWSLPTALIDDEIEVFRVTRRGLPGFSDCFSEEELKELSDRDAWEKKEVITVKGRPLQLNGKRAAEYGLAKDLVESFSAFKELYGLEHDPDLLEPTWIDTVVRALASPYVAVLLLIVGGVALMIEVQTPGIGIGGFLAAVCFVLFFWSRFLGGTVGWLEVLLFLLGVFCLLLEFFVLPGFGIFGLGGGLLILVSLVLASQSFIVPRNTYQWMQLQRSLLILVLAAIGIGVLISVLNRMLPKTPGLKNLMLLPPSEQDLEQMERRRSLLDVDQSWVGAQGITVTVLLPSGKARFEKRVLDVISQDGDPIEPNTEVVITEIRGNRIYVRPQSPGG